MSRAVEPSIRSPRVVVGVVDTSSGRRALRAAYNTARGLGGDLFVLTSYSTRSLPRGHQASFVLMEAALREQGHVIADELGISRWSLPTYCDAPAGEAIDVLVRAASTADVLVVGDDRGTAADRPSVAEECLRRSTCRVLVA